MIFRHEVKSCCGKKSYVFVTQTGIKKVYLDKFRKAGYATPPQFIKAGLFYLVKPGFTASCVFGAKKIQVQASGKNAVKTLDQFEKLLDALTKK